MNHNLTAYKQGATTIELYGYDWDGLRETKTVGGVTTAGNSCGGVQALYIGICCGYCESEIQQYQPAPSDNWLIIIL